MRKVIFTILTSTAMLVAVPTSALARNHHRGHHRSRVHSARAHREHFGSDSQVSTTPGTPSQNAGTVVSFSGNVLTVSLSDGTTVRGNVTDATKLVCQSAPSTVQTTDEGSGSGDNGENSSGGDNGDRGADNSSGSTQPDGATQSEETGEDNGDRAANSDAGDAGDDQGAAQQTCTTSALIPGAVVREAVLIVSGSGSTWSNLDLSSQ